MLLAGAALCLAAAGAGLWWRSGPTPDASVYLAEADRQVEAGELQHAVNALRRATRAIPDNPELRLRVANLYLRLNQLPAAEAWARFAKQTGAEDNRVDPIFAMALLQQNKLTTLIKMIEPGGRDAHAEADVRVSLALAHIYLGDLRIGEQLLADARQRDPSTPRLPIGLARLALANGDLGGAKTQLAAALAAAPHSLETLRLDADVLRIGGDADAALAVLGQALGTYPDDLATIVARADILIAKDRLDDAEKDVDHALDLAPQSLTPNFLRAVIVARRGDYVKADELVMTMSQYFTTLPAGYYLQGVVKYALGQYPLARDSLTRYLGRHPGEPGALRLLALIAVHDGENRRAIELLQPIVAADPSDRATTGVLARAYLAEGRKDAAVALYERAAAAKPHDAERQTDAALMRVHYGDAAAGFAALQSIADTGAGLEFAGPIVVLDRLRSGDVTKAAATAEALAQHDGDNLVIRNLLGGVRLAQFRYDEAARIFASVIEADPGFLSARRNLARTYLAMGRPKDAQRVYEELLRRQPKDLPSFFALADLAAAAGDIDAAAARLRQAIAAAPDEVEPGFRLAQLFARQKDWKRAIDAAHALVERFPRDPQAVDLAASIRADSGDKPGAVAEFFPLAQWFPRSSGIVQRYAEYQRKAGDIDGARKSLEKALVLDPGNLPVMRDVVSLEYEASGADAALARARALGQTQPVAASLLAADILAGTGRRDEAIAALKDGQARHPATELVVRLADLTYAGGQHDAAKHLLQSWLGVHDDALPARLALANDTLLDRDLDAAQGLYERAVEQAPTNVIALNNLAWLYNRKHDPRAADLAQRAFRLSPDGVTADTLGLTMLSAGDAHGALPFLETAGKARPADMAVQYHLALAFEATGDKRQALSLFERVAASNDTFDEKDDARRHLAALRHN